MNFLFLIILLTMCLGALVNGILYAVVFCVCGVTWTGVIYCLLGSALITLSVIDFKTHKIPMEINAFILLLGLIGTVLDISGWRDHLTGLLAVSVPMGILLFVSKGRAIGGGDVKLMAAAGLLLGCEKILLACFIGCAAASVIHLIRMKAGCAGRVFALGPYLAFGIMISALWGDVCISLLSVLQYFP